MVFQNVRRMEAETSEAAFEGLMEAEAAGEDGFVVLAQGRGVAAEGVGGLALAEGGGGLVVGADERAVEFGPEAPGGEVGVGEEVEGAGGGAGRLYVV